MKIPLICAELAEETGWHIGDGSMNFYKQENKLKGFYQLRGHIEEDKQHYIERIKPVFKLLYNLDISLREMPSTRVFGFQIWNNELITFKQNFGLPLGKKFDISIPLVFLQNNELKSSVIRGIFDTDGGIYLDKNRKFYPNVYISTICPTLVNQLITLFNEFKLRATLTSELCNKDFNRQRAYRVTIRGEEMLHKFMKIINPKNSKHQAKYQKFLNIKKL